MCNVCNVQLGRKTRIHATIKRNNNVLTFIELLTGMINILQSLKAKPPNVCLHMLSEFLVDSRQSLLWWRWIAVTETQAGCHRGSPSLSTA